MHRPSPEISGWMRSFERAVRQEDYSAGRELFSEDVIAFGTVSFRAAGLDTLVSQQWRHIWGSTEGFRFEHDTAISWESGDVATIAATWSSTGFGADGDPFEREGRVTLVLSENGQGWQATHTHFSMGPDRPRPAT